MQFRQILLVQCGGWIAEGKREGKKNNYLAIRSGEKLGDGSGNGRDRGRYSDGKKDL